MHNPRHTASSCRGKVCKHASCLVPVSVGACQTAYAMYRRHGRNQQMPVPSSPRASRHHLCRACSHALGHVQTRAFAYARDVPLHSMCIAGPVAEQESLHHFEQVGPYLVRGAAPHQKRCSEGQLLPDFVCYWSSCEQPCTRRLSWHLINISSDGSQLLPPTQPFCEKKVRHKRYMGQLQVSHVMTA